MLWDGFMSTAAGRRTRQNRRGRGLRLWAIPLVLALAGCSSVAEGEPAPVPSTTASAPNDDQNEGESGGVQPTGTPTVVATGLEAPWSMVRLESGSTLVSQRDTATIMELQLDGTSREVGAVPGVVPGGEGGLLGLEVVPEGPWLYAYFTSSDDNRIVRFSLDGDAGDYSLSDPDEVLTGLARAGNHNGGRIELGPDGMLYATVGDAGDTASAQNPGSLNGKILRMEPDGSVPSDNPTPGSLVYSMGHRNPQGIAWDADGRLWAAEFGQDTWDELNLIEPGANYGWPVVEGIAGDPAYTNPVYQWATDEASPSGLAVVGGTLFMAALKGQRLWTIQPGNPSTVTGWFTGEFGRIRDVVPGPDGTIWLLTNNTDGRGDPRNGDDRILQYTLAPVA